MLLYKRKRNAILASLAVTVIAGIVYAVNKLSTEENDMELSREMLQLSQPLTEKRYTTKAITVVLTSSIIAARLPLEELLHHSNNIVFVLPPKLRKAELFADQRLMSRKGVNGVIHKYKIIECDNARGMWFVVKHLKPDTLIVCEDDLPLHCEMPQEINNFVRDVVILEQNSNAVYESVMPYFKA
ncbi:hypothetical protein BABINDRAFT_163622 [Babjeviella inositovora NRRL Y-12698]|uniref:Peroxisome assembly protein 22 n=1 Tax=Babjeviella inositovora NRRL Y-12698 TaxID=984486 RepID=A0A1E3QK39_9ASCO|nr:uncharacterized protein BABINDRAFT_163622 [Babjeviella inositovora NRRL Y-12698]ODQ77367.1 hypothetical protein BABINDRAFT_163622 [Babjeviella inositovora NRRL Y-12698]